MLDIIGKKKIYFLISILIILPGLISLFVWGLRLSIDFTGGSRVIFLFPNNVNEKIQNEVRGVFEEEKAGVVTMQSSEKRLIVRTKQINEKQFEEILAKLTRKFDGVKREEFETIGPTVGSETAWNAVKSVALASFLIVLYIAWSFRNVPKPTSSWRFGICAIAALLHDVLVVVGIFSILGHFYNVEIDSMFVTALLTIIGFSVHDTIVVFDRIRENLRLNAGLEFAQIVNNSILQTLVRSLNTSFTTMLVLFTLLMFGGETTFWFVAALLIGIASGTYSSIFNAAALLVVWDEWGKKRLGRNFGN
jgi:preprotein translocase subunit SecF